MGRAWQEDIAGEYVPPPPDPDKPHARKPHWVPYVIGRGDMRELLKSTTVGPFERLLLRTLYASGMRGRELTSLSREDVHTETGEIHLKDRVVLVDAETCQGLAALDWPSWDLDLIKLDAMLRHAAKGCAVWGRYWGMKQRTLLPQALRVAFATHFLERGGGLFALHNLMGYPYIGDTENVIEVAVGLWRSVYDRTHPLARGAMRGGGHQSDLTLAEVLSMVEAAGDGEKKHTHDGLILRVIYAAGLRVSELVDLKVADVECDERRLFLRDAKEHKDRFSLIDPGTAEQLRAVVAGRGLEEPVFEETADYTVRRFITAAAKKTGLDKKFAENTLSPHTFRHAHASHLYEGGMEPGTIRRLLGHDSVEDTMTYVACGPAEQRAAYNRAALVDF